MKIDIQERIFHFRQPAGTSRGVYTTRRSWFVSATDGERTGVGECAPLPKLSCDDIPNYAEVLRRFCDEVEATGEIPYDALRDYPSMLFGLETALSTLELRSEIAHARHNSSELDSALAQSRFSPLTSPLSIPINGLVWMGTYDEMRRRMDEKLQQGFRCIKLKIGAIDFDSEIALLKQIREHYGPREVELRVDANGAFSFDEALYKLELLSQYALHSIEQPIQARQWANMAELQREAPLAIALDEELIGINDPDQKRQMLNIIRPAYIVLKPSLHGGMAGVREWVAIAREMGIGSWITSALESNVGLYAIARLTAEIYGPDIRMPQGLGTGQLFTDNIPMPLEIQGSRLMIKK